MHLENPWILESFSRPWKFLKFSFIHFGPWKSLKFNWRTFWNLQKTLTNASFEANRIGIESDIDSQMKMEMVDFKNKNLLLSEYIHSLFGTFVQSNKLGPWKKMWSLKIFEKSLNFTREVDELFENCQVHAHWLLGHDTPFCEN